jgi:hypothetical protein
MLVESFSATKTRLGVHTSAESCSLVHSFNNLSPTLCQINPAKEEKLDLATSLTKKRLSS